jgi:hypothetical protein
MPAATAYYFVRANGHTAHNDPAKPDCFVPGEPPAFPQTRFDYVQYCLGYDVIRIGWPGTGDLRRAADVPESTPCYGALTDRVRDYLRAFKSIPAGAPVVNPDKQRPGVVYAGDATLPYSYFHERPTHPFECAHRVGVRWDRDRETALPVEYRAEELGMSPRGGWWLWAFHHLTTEKHGAIVQRINDERTKRSASTA